MSITTTTQADDQRMATITESDEVLAATERCDRCGGQAYVDVMVKSGSLLLCAHHATKVWDGLVKVALLINDHRPALLKQEGRQKDAASAV